MTVGLPCCTGAVGSAGIWAHCPSFGEPVYVERAKLAAQPHATAGWSQAGSSPRASCAGFQAAVEAALRAGAGVQPAERTGTRRWRPTPIAPGSSLKKQLRLQQRELAALQAVTPQPRAAPASRTLLPKQHAADGKRPALASADASLSHPAGTARSGQPGAAVPALASTGQNRPAAAKAPVLKPVVSTVKSAALAARVVPPPAKKQRLEAPPAAGGGAGGGAPAAARKTKAATSLDAGQASRHAAVAGHVPAALCRQPATCRRRPRRQRSMRLASWQISPFLSSSWCSRQGSCQWGARRLTWWRGGQKAGCPRDQRSCMRWQKIVLLDDVVLPCRLQQAMAP